jgi:hypothetical protein
VLVASAVAAVIVEPAVTASPAGAQTTSVVEQFFGFVGPQAQSWVVPPFVEQLTIAAAGGGGGNNDDDRAGGPGALVGGTVSVDPGDVVTMTVGGRGQQALNPGSTTCDAVGLGGWGYGTGGSGETGGVQCGGGGGGSTAVVISSSDVTSGTDVMIAGAGGGAGASSPVDRGAPGGSGYASGAQPDAQGIVAAAAGNDGAGSAAGDGGSGGFNTGPDGITGSPHDGQGGGGGGGGARNGGENGGGTNGSGSAGGGGGGNSFLNPTAPYLVSEFDLSESPGGSDADGFVNVMYEIPSGYDAEVFNSPTPTQFQTPSFVDTMWVDVVGALGGGNDGGVVNDLDADNDVVGESYVPLSVGGTGADVRGMIPASPSDTFVAVAGARGGAGANGTDSVDPTPGGAGGGSAADGGQGAGSDTGFPEGSGGGGGGGASQLDVQGAFGTTTVVVAGGGGGTGGIGWNINTLFPGGGGSGGGKTPGASGEFTAADGGAASGVGASGGSGQCSPASSGGNATPLSRGGGGGGGGDGYRGGCGGQGSSFSVGGDNGGGGGTGGSSYFTTATGAVLDAGFPMTNGSSAGQVVVAWSTTALSAESGDDQHAADRFAAPHVVRVVDAQTGAPVPGVRVTFTAPTTGPSVVFDDGDPRTPPNVSRAVTDADGRATSAAILACTPQRCHADGGPGNVKVVASVVLGDSVRFHLTVDPPATSSGGPAQPVLAAPRFTG